MSRASPVARMTRPPNIASESSERRLNTDENRAGDARNRPVFGERGARRLQQVPVRHAGRTHGLAGAAAKTPLDVRLDALVRRSERSLEQATASARCARADCRSRPRASDTSGTPAGKSRSARMRRCPHAPWRADFPATRIRAERRRERSCRARRGFRGSARPVRIERGLEARRRFRSSRGSGKPRPTVARAVVHQSVSLAADVASAAFRCAALSSRLGTMQRTTPARRRRRESSPPDMPLTISFASAHVAPTSEGQARQAKNDRAATARRRAVVVHASGRSTSNASSELEQRRSLCARRPLQLPPRRKSARVSARPTTESASGALTTSQAYGANGRRRSSWRARSTAAASPRDRNGDRLVRLRTRVKAHRDFGDHAERSPRAGHQSREIEAGDVLHDASARRARSLPRPVTNSTPSTRSRGVPKRRRPAGRRTPSRSSRRRALVAAVRIEREPLAVRSPPHRGSRRASFRRAP